MMSCQTARLITYAYIISSYTIAILSALPTVWFIFHRQSGPASLGFWVTISNLNHAINSTVWRRDVINRAPVWCDIASKISLVYSTGVICSCLCMAKFLAYAMGPNPSSITHQMRRKINIRTYLFSIGFPLMMIPFSYTYSPHRFSLIRTIGCATSYAVTWPTFLFFIIWGPIFGSVAAAYTIYVAVRLWKTRKDMNDDPKKHGSKVPLRRLAWLCLMYTMVAFPLSIYYAYILVATGGYVPYTPHVFKKTAGSIKYDPDKMSPGFNDSLANIGGLIFVAFFTFSKEMRSAQVNASKRVICSTVTSLQWITERFQKRIKRNASLRNSRNIFQRVRPSDLELARTFESRTGESLELSTLKSMGSGSIADNTLASDDHTVYYSGPNLPSRAYRQGDNISIMEFEDENGRPSFLKAFHELHPDHQYR